MKQNNISIQTIVLLLVFIVLIPLLPLLISGQWDWWQAWLYALISILGFVISRVLAAQRHPDIIAERARFMQQQDSQPWDKKLAPLLALGGGLIPLIAGLDARFGWPPDFNLAVEMVALTILLGGYLLGSYALIENRFFSGVVRLQTDRDQQVVSTGPYHWVRHPGYAGALCSYWATPFLLDAAWALLPVILVTIVLIVRTRLEDAFLQEALTGYRNYAQQVRYRLLPGVW